MEELGIECLCLKLTSMSARSCLYQDMWAAVEAELYSCEENDKLQRGESLDVEPEPAPVAATIDPDTELETVLASATRNKSLLQLIAERRTKHGCD
jgi:hypothetical protein